MERLRLIPKWFYVITLLVLLIILGIMLYIKSTTNDNTKKHSNDISKKNNVGFKSNNVLCNLSDISESSIENYIREINTFRIDEETREYESLQSFIALIRSNGEAKNKSEAEIEKEIADFKETSAAAYQYIVDFADKIENAVNNFKAKKNDLSSLKKSICGFCISYGYATGVCDD